MRPGCYGTYHCHLLVKTIKLLKFCGGFGLTLVTFYFVYCTKYASTAANACSLRKSLEWCLL